MDNRKLTNADLAEIKKRAEAATAGPWSVISVAGTPFLTALGKGILADLKPQYDGSKNYEFIAKSRQDVPALLAEVERLRNENSLLCPIGDLDVITSLRTEKSMYMERIAELEAEVERLRAELEIECNRKTEIIDEIFGEALQESAKRIADEIRLKAGGA